MTKENRGFICIDCGFVGEPKTIVKGSFWIELLLWFFFIIPGLIYTLWRLTTKEKACPACKHQTMIPADTPRGAQLLKESKQ